MNWIARAPSNIALIKYMGKIDSQLNRPTNASLSYTLNDLWCEVQVQLIDGPEDKFQLLDRSDIVPMQLSAKSIQRFLNHLDFLKQQFQFKGSLLICSGNNFPADCGLASSAASFAALTRAVVLALSELTHRELPSDLIQANWSRLASGSSCRSFYSPWCLWTEEKIEKIALPQQNLLHRVIVVDRNKKSVSSSEAHKRVASSLLFQNRPERAELRLQQLLSALQENNWLAAYQLCWQEFWDMHALFETAMPPFGYLTEESLRVLQRLRALWEEKGDGPLITMDAGPNIHLLFREDQTDLKWVQEMESIR